MAKDLMRLQLAYKGSGRPGVKTLGRPRPSPLFGSAERRGLAVGVIELVADDESVALDFVNEDRIVVAPRSDRLLGFAQELDRVAGSKFDLLSREVDCAYGCVQHGGVAKRQIIALAGSLPCVR